MRDAVLLAFRHPLVRTVTICAAALSFFGVSYMPFLPVLAGLLLLMHAPVVALALPGLVAISFGFLAMNTSMTTLLQTETDPALRGRLLGVYAMIFAGLQPMGTLLYGALAVRVPIFDAISVGACIVGATAVWAATRPALWRIGQALTEVAVT